MPKLSNARLTETYVKHLKPKVTRFEVFDALLPGFGIRVAPSGLKTWIVFGREGARRTRASLGRYPATSLSDAREAAVAALRSMHLGTYHSDRNTASYEHVLEDWYSREQRKNKSFKEVERVMTAFVTPKLKGKEISEVERRHLISIIDAVADNGTPTQAARLRSYISRFFAWSVERGIIDVNPAISLPKVLIEQSRDRVLSNEEITNIWKASNSLSPQFRAIIRLLILTGQRKSEVSGMKWLEVDFNENVWILPSDRTKNSKPHLVHLSNLAISELSHTAKTSELVFTTTGRTPVSGFSNVKKKIDQQSGVTNWRIHDLRRTFASTTTEKLGFNPHVVDLILNHQSGTLTSVAKIYQRGLYVKERKEVMDAWGKYIEDLIKV